MINQKSIENCPVFSRYYESYIEMGDPLFSNNGTYYEMRSNGVKVFQPSDDEDACTISYLCPNLFALGVTKYSKTGEFTMKLAYEFNSKWYEMKIHSSEINESVCYKLMRVGLEFHPTSENKEALVHYLLTLVQSVDYIDFVHEKSIPTKVNNTSLLDALIKKIFRIKNRIQRRIDAIKKEEKM